MAEPRVETGSCSIPFGMLKYCWYGTDCMVLVHLKTLVEVHDPHTHPQGHQ